MCVYVFLFAHSEEKPACSRPFLSTKRDWMYRFSFEFKKNWRSHTCFVNSRVKEGTSSLFVSERCVELV